MSADPLYDKSKAWTKEQYDLMQVHAHELGYHLLTPYRKGLKNIRVGVITATSSSRKPKKGAA
jgi:hypothetical protein